MYKNKNGINKIMYIVYKVNFNFLNQNFEYIFSIRYSLKR